MVKFNVGFVRLHQSDGVATRLLLIRRVTRVFADLECGSIHEHSLHFKSLHQCRFPWTSGDAMCESNEAIEMTPDRSGHRRHQFDAYQNKPLDKHHQCAGMHQPSATQLFHHHHHRFSRVARIAQETHRETSLSPYHARRLPVEQKREI